MAQLALAALFGFFLPGFFLSRLLKSPATILSSFLLSLLLLFHTVFWLEIAGVTLTFHGVLLVLLPGSIVLAALCRFTKVDLGLRLPAFNSLSSVEKGVLCISTAFLTLFIVRSFLSPLSGYDTFFRWNFLPQQMLRFGNFSYYPPLTSEDFKKYFYVDGIPPAIPFAYWWLYAAYGKVSAAVTGIFVSMQFVLLFYVTFALAKELSGRNAGAFAVAILCCSSLFFWSVFIGQETGLTALSLGSMLFFLHSAKRTGETGSVAIAAAAAAAGALSREYGCAYVLCGALAALWLKLPRKAVMQFLFVATAIAAPWYVRNWIVAGNPFYSNPVGSLFAVNPVHVSILSAYGSILGLQQNGWFKIGIILRQLLEYAPLQLTLGVAACLLLARRFFTLTFFSLVAVLLWMLSIGKTGGGYFWTLRVLGPALVLVSVSAGIHLDELLQDGKKIVVHSFFFVLIAGYAFFYDFVLPARPWDIPVSQWSLISFHPNPSHEVWARSVAPHLQRLHCRILSDDSYAHAGLYEYRIEVVPVWSPEVRFLFDSAITKEGAGARLASLNIRAVMISRQSMNNRYLEQFPFFSGDRKDWTLYLSTSRSEVYLLDVGAGL